MGKRLDPIGVIAAVSNARGLLDMSNARLVPDAQASLTPGEAVGGMMRKGLGCGHRPFSLTPQLLANKPLERLFHEGLGAGHFKRCTLGRTRTEASTDGCDGLVQEVALAVCAQAGLDQRFNHLDPTRFSRTGEYVPDSDEHAMLIPHGYSKDHRPALQQAVWALMVSQDGGVPCGRTSWAGHTSVLVII
jgi:transposase